MRVSSGRAGASSISRCTRNRGPARPPRTAPGSLVQVGGKCTAQDWAALRDEVARGFRQVARGEQWRLPPERLAGHEHIAVAGRIQYQAPARALFLLACERLLSLPDGQRLKVCDGPGCDRLFIRQKRGAYCSAKCWRIERARRTRVSLTPEELRARRHRYYINRVRKLRGTKVAVHVKERPRRPEAGEDEPRPETGRAAHAQEK